LTPEIGGGGGSEGSGERGAVVSGWLNTLPVPEARAALLSCCGSARWVERMLAGRPYRDDATLYAAAEREWWASGRDDWLEAFAAHPRIGAATADARSRGEQAGLRGAPGDVRRAIEAGNAAYERRFGYLYLVCATGRSAAEMAADLERRLRNDPERELRVAAAEQAKITRLRLETLGGRTA
jgi:2-oxo-4-hydroxy-4-carboxy-5-ureidoimidazoline decarboxylase